MKKNRFAIITGTLIIMMLTMIAVSSTVNLTVAENDHSREAPEPGDFFEWDVLNSSTYYQNLTWLDLAGASYTPLFGVNISTGDVINCTISHMLAGDVFGDPIGFNGTWTVGNTTISGGIGDGATHYDVYANLNFYWFGSFSPGLIYTELNWTAAKEAADNDLIGIDWEETTWTAYGKTVDAIKFNSTRSWYMGGDWTLELIYHNDTGVLLYGFTDAPASDQTLEIRISEESLEQIEPTPVGELTNWLFYVTMVAVIVAGLLVLRIKKGRTDFLMEL